MQRERTPKRIFISYRREDSSGYAGRLFDALGDAFGADAVFMDIDTLAPGEDFRKAIDVALRDCEIALVIIGPTWISLRRRSVRRLDLAEDFVRQEIEAVLARNIRVLPVLVGGASIPEGSSLPMSIAPLADRHAFELSDRRWHADVEELISTLRNGRWRRPAWTRLSSTGRWRASIQLVTVGVVIAAIAIVALLGILSRTTQSSSGPERPTPSASTTGVPRLTVDVTGLSGAESLLTFLNMNDGHIVYLSLECFDAGYTQGFPSSYCLGHDATLDGVLTPGSYLDVFSGAPATTCRCPVLSTAPASGVVILEFTAAVDTVNNSFGGAGSTELKGYFSVAEKGEQGFIPGVPSAIRLVGVPAAQVHP
jgi:hypothetical protein